MTDIEQLHSEAATARARAQAAEEQIASIAAAKAERRQQAESVWRTAVISNSVATDEALEVEGKEYEKKFREALGSLDLDTALRQWVAYRATRTTRRFYRNAAVNAEAIEKTGARVLDDNMRYIPVDILEQIELTLDTLASDLGQQHAEAMLGSPDYGDDTD